MKKLLLPSTLLILLLAIACKDNDVPPIENEEETITDVRLLFDPVAGGDPLPFVASDPDGEGEAGIETPTVHLEANSGYQMFIRLENSIVSADLTKDIEDEGTEHMFFFGFTDALFTAPEGDGNIDSPADKVNYIDRDENGMPLGLITGWETGEVGTGTLRIVLKHQPGLKSATSTSQDGASDLDLTFTVVIE